MKIDATKFAIDESRSNTMVVAQKYADCPINEICFYMAVGGAVVEKTAPATMSFTLTFAWWWIPTGVTVIAAVFK